MNFSIKLCQRDFRGNIVEGKYVELETNDAVAISDLYDKTTAVHDRKPRKQENDKDTRVPGSNKSK